MALAVAMILRELSGARLPRLRWALALLRGRRRDRRPAVVPDRTLRSLVVLARARHECRSTSPAWCWPWLAAVAVLSILVLFLWPRARRLWPYSPGSTRAPSPASAWPSCRSSSTSASPRRTSTTSCGSELDLMPAAAPVRRRTATRAIVALVLVVVALSAVVRLVNLDVFPTLVFDEHYYVHDAGSIIHGRIGPRQPSPWKPGDGLSLAHPPLGTLSIAAGILAFGDGPWGWRVPSAIAGTLLIALVYPLARRLAPVAALGARRPRAGRLRHDADRRVAHRCARPLRRPLVGGLHLLRPALRAVRPAGALARAHRRRPAAWPSPASGRGPWPWRPPWRSSPSTGCASGGRGAAAPGPSQGAADDASGARRRRRRPALPAACAGAACLVALPLAVYVASYADYFASGHTLRQWLHLQGYMATFNWNVQGSSTMSSRPLTWIFDATPIWYRWAETPHGVAGPDRDRQPAAVVGLDRGLRRPAVARLEAARRRPGRQRRCWSPSSTCPGWPRAASRTSTTSRRRSRSWPSWWPRALSRLAGPAAAARPLGGGSLCRGRRGHGRRRRRHARLAPGGAGRPVARCSRAAVFALRRRRAPATRSRATAGDPAPARPGRRRSPPGCTPAPWPGWPSPGCRSWSRTALVRLLRAPGLVDDLALRRPAVSRSAPP